MLDHPLLEDALEARGGDALVKLHVIGGVQLAFLHAIEVNGAGERVLFPQARLCREALETYLKRVTALEDLANSFEGVEQSFAIQAGREIRIVVRPNVVDDLGAIMLSRDIAKKVEDTLEYPGQIKVTVIRETRSVDFAK